MANQETKDSVKIEIAHLLMKDNIGLLMPTIVQRIIQTDSPALIKNVVDEMHKSGDLNIVGQRYVITTIGRSYYSEINNG